MTIAFDAEGNSPILPLEKREYVGNLKEFRINSNKSHVRVIGNHNKVIINTNRGHLEIVGNNTKVKIMYNCGEISYIGNNGTLLIGKESTNTNVSYIGSNGILKVLSNNKLNNIPRKNDDNIVTEKSSRAEKSEIIDNNKKKSFIQMMKSPFQKNDQHKCESSNSFIFNENCHVSPRQRRPYQNDTSSHYNNKSNVTGQGRIIGENTSSVTSAGENAGGRRQHQRYNNNLSEHYYVSAESFKRSKTTSENINKGSDYNKNQNGSQRQSPNYNTQQNRQKPNFGQFNGQNKYFASKYEINRKYGTNTNNDLSGEEQSTSYGNQNGRYGCYDNKDFEKDKEKLNREARDQSSNYTVINEQNSLEREISPNNSNLRNFEKKYSSGKNYGPIKRWIPPSLRPQRGLTQNDKNDAIFRKVRGILNKLTPEKFQELSDDLLQIDLNSTVVLNGVILLIFEKALDEPKYSSMYAQLCKRLSKEAPNFDDPPTPSTCTFLRLLLNVCRDKFLSRSTSAFGIKSGISTSDIYFDRDLKDDEITTEEEEKRHVAKQRMLGNVKFIGELSKLQMLSETVLHKCIQSLLDKKQRPDATLQDWCEDMECLCQLIRTCGKNLDTEQGKKLMKQYFETMDQRSKSKIYPPRIRFILRDIIELRENNWVPRKVTASEGPVPIRDIRNDDSNIIRQPYVNHRRDLRNNMHETDNWMNTLSLNLQSGFNNMLSSLNVTGPSAIMQPNYNNSKNRQHNQRNIQKHQNNRYSNHNQFNNFYYNNGMGSNSSTTNKNFMSMNNKDMVPTFNRTLIASAQDNVENLQMRPAANSLLFKANMNIKTPQMLPISRPPLLSSGGSQGHASTPIITSIAPRSEAGGVIITPVSSVIANRTANALVNNDSTVQPSEEIINSAKSSTTSISNLPVHNLKDGKEPTLTVQITKHGSVEKQMSGGKIGKKDKGPNKEELLKKVSTFLTENLMFEDEDNGVKNIDQIFSAFVELKVPDKFMKDTCYTLLSEILDKSESQHGLLIGLMHQLRKENKLQSHALLDGFKQIINKMSEKEATIPRVTTHVASLLSRAVSAKLCNISDIAAYTDGGQHYPLLLLVLQQLHKNMSRDELEDLFVASKVDLIASLPEADRNKDRLAEILEDRNLTFLYPLLKVQAEMLKQIQTEDNPQAFYKWIKTNVDSKYHSNTGFINSLMTVILKFISQATILADGTDTKIYPDKSTIEKEESLLHKYCYILETFLNGNIDVQLIAIYALQVYCFNLDFPKGMLCRWFKNLYEANVIEEDAFFRWKEEISDEYPGKGMALFQVNNWLTWLEQAESEDED